MQAILSDLNSRGKRAWPPWPSSQENTYTLKTSNVKHGQTWLDTSLASCSPPFHFKLEHFHQCERHEVQKDSICNQRNIDSNEEGGECLNPKSILHVQDHSFTPSHQNWWSKFSCRGNAGQCGQLRASTYTSYLFLAFPGIIVQCFRQSVGSYFLKHTNGLGACIVGLHLNCDVFVIQC